MEAVGFFAQALEHVGEVFARVMTEAFARAQQRVDDRRSIDGLWVAHELPIFLADGREADAPFHRVVVDVHLSVFEVAPERFPLVPGVTAGDAQFTFGQSLRFPANDHTGQAGENRPSVGETSKRHQLRGKTAFTAKALLLVEMAHQAQDQGGLAGIIGEGLLELAAHVRHAPDQFDARMLFGETLVGRITVALQEPLEVFEQVGQGLGTARSAPGEHDVAARATVSAQESLLGLARLDVRIEVFDRRFISLDVIAAQELLLHVAVDRFEPIGDDLDPAHHALARELDATAPIDPLLAKQRQMVGIFGQNQMHQQSDRGDPFDRANRRGREHRRGLPIGLAPILGPHEAAAVKTRRIDLQLEGLFLADALEALRLGLHLLGLDHHRLEHGQMAVTLLAGRPRGRGLARRLRGSRRRARRIGFELGDLGFEALQGKLQLTPVGPLTLTAKKLTLQPRDLRAQLRQLFLPRTQRRLLGRQLLLQGVDLGSGGGQGGHARVWKKSSRYLQAQKLSFIPSLRMRALQLHSIEQQGERPAMQLEFVFPRPARARPAETTLFESLVQHP